MVEAVRIQGEPLPVDIAPLIKSQRVPIQTGVAPGVAVTGKEELIQDVVDLLRRCLYGIAEFLPRPLDGQEDLDGQTHLERDDDGRAGGVAQVGGQRAGVEQDDLCFAGAGITDAGGVQGEAAEVVPHCFHDVHLCYLQNFNMCGGIMAPPLAVVLMLWPLSSPSAYVKASCGLLFRLFLWPRPPAAQ